ncbi:Major outer membrane protein [wastewater metagenome]|uniref:Major outer membrane protein n=2 Tax=unclassified sequences TaxID=12908 RepID=A0A5B8R8T5_9ZZZZ|nr:MULTISPECIES: porin [Arhodomonas]MCS4504854.1 porin [Arhodomonas aquaeolei]QEA05130.1 major outer membrane protein [uncultured organism]
MKKAISALAVAAALGASSAHAADFRVNDDTLFSVYGSIEFIYYSQEQATDGGDTESRSEFADNGSTIGFAGEHTWDNGLTGYFKAEFEHNADEEKGAGGINDGDKAYIGVKGNFGNVRAGSWDNIYNDAIQDPVDPFEAFSPSMSDISGEGDTIAYFSPKMGGFSFQVASQIRGDGDTPTSKQPLTDESAFQVVGMYEVNTLTFAVGYDDRGIVSQTGAAGGDPAEDGVFGASVTWDLAPLTLAARAEQQGETVEDDEVGYYSLNAAYDYGMGTLTATVTEVDPDADDEDSRTEFNLLGTYNVGSNMYVYAEAGWYDKENDEDDAMGVGVVYEF